MAGGSKRMRKYLFISFKKTIVSRGVSVVDVVPVELGLLALVLLSY